LNLGEFPDLNVPGSGGGVGALIMGRYKLILGPNGGDWSSQLNATSCKAFGT